MKTRNILIITDDGQFELAVNPKQLVISGDNGDKTMELLNLGTVMVPGHRNPMKVTLQTFLPASDSPFYKGTSTEKIISMIDKAKDGQRPIRMIVSGTDINHKFIINSTSNTYTEGQRDVSVTWGLTEDRMSSIKAVASESKMTDTDTGLNSRPGENDTPKNVTVVKGDTLWDIAVKYYGDGGKWKKIAEANGVTDPKKLKIGTVLEIPNEN